MTDERVNKLLKSTKVIMKVEGFQISDELEETGRRLLIGELSIDDYLSDCKQRARGYANEIRIRKRRV